MKTQALVLFFALISLCMGCYKNPVERNTIVFNDHVESVQDSLIAMQKLLMLLPVPMSSTVTNFYYRDNKLYINSTRMGHPDSIRVDTVQLFKNFSTEQKRQFIRISKYLRRNYITSGHWEGIESLWLFTYRELDDGDYHDLRSVVTLVGRDTSSLKMFRVLDQQGMVSLIVGKDAIIR